eukprot:Nk52_evm3s227 gene=Nk52_evmTU3s227
MDNDNWSHDGSILLIEAADNSATKQFSVCLDPNSKTFKKFMHDDQMALGELGLNTKQYVFLQDFIQEHSDKYMAEYPKPEISSGFDRFLAFIWVGGAYSSKLNQKNKFLISEFKKKWLLRTNSTTGGLKSDQMADNGISKVFFSMDKKDSPYVIMQVTGFFNSP